MTPAPQRATAMLDEAEVPGEPWVAPAAAPATPRRRAPRRGWLERVALFYKDWDRLGAADGAIPRSARVAVFAAILAGDVAQWVWTREADVSYASHLGGAATGLLLGVLALRRRPTRTTTAWLRKVRRPAYLAALAAYVFLLAFGAAWYACVWPPRPVARAWLDRRGDRKSRPCCVQVFDCGLAPADFGSLDCAFDARSRAYRVVDGDGVAYGGCGALAASLLRRNHTPPGGGGGDLGAR